MHRVETTLCEDCYQDIPLPQIRRHYNANLCPKKEVRCPREDCRLLVVKEDLSFHLKYTCKRMKKRNLLLQKIKGREENKQKQKVHKCPECETKIINMSLHDHLQLYCKKRVVYCERESSPALQKFNSDGCGKRMTFQQFEDHLRRRTCLILKKRDAFIKSKKKENEVRLTCSACGETNLTSDEFPIHENVQCAFRIMPCRNGTLGCKIEFHACDEKIHLETHCRIEKEKKRMIQRRSERENNFECRNGCGAILEKGKVQMHMQKDCVHRFIECKCGQFIKRKDVKEHKAEDLYYFLHHVIRCSYFVKQEKYTQKARQRQQEKEKKIKKL
eukprot:augustus_masked-scaffold_6-processed-gene-6.49-mRNA-1 protein AED:1.00 eAED:1.00 QI:0/-1/0/0/-1/1/1/0/329